jgi:antitoxin component YwqK of YwqJK toxin-antitoxin module
MVVLGLAFTVMFLVACRPKDQSLTGGTPHHAGTAQEERFGPDVSGLPDGVQHLPWNGGTFIVSVTAGSKEGRALWSYANGVEGWQGGFQQDRSHGWVEQRDTTGALTCAGHYANGLKEGHWRFHHTDCLPAIGLPLSIRPMGRWSSTEPIAEGRMEGGVPRGYWILRYPSGVVRMEGDIRDGLQNGWWRSYDAQGRLVHEGQYVDGARDGHQMHYVDGVLREEGGLCRGSRCGAWIRYNANGEPEAIDPAHEGGGLLLY